MLLNSHASWAKNGFGRRQVKRIVYCGLLHDIGKISIPESLLNKPGQLTEEEWNLVRTHAKRGYEILKDANFPWPVAEMALHHMNASMGQVIQTA